MMVGRSVVRLLRLQGHCVHRQLVLEEALLRNSDESWCVINDGVGAPAIVMGVSGVASELMDISRVVREEVPVLRRFSGGGTVVLDESSIMASLIFAQGQVRGLPLYPRPIMEWTAGFYRDALRRSHEGGSGSGGGGGGGGEEDAFVLHEQDYAFADRKFGGNAQSIVKGRWLHHTSFLWDYDPERMDLLTTPKKQPAYRSNRRHRDFLVTLREVLGEGARPRFLAALEEALARQALDVVPATLSYAESHLASGTLCRTERVHLGAEDAQRQQLEGSLRDAA